MLKKRRYMSPLCLLILLCFARLGAAGMQGGGRVGLQGSIAETPCAIDTQSRDQSVDIGATPIAIIARDGRGSAYPFSIRLLNCNLARLDSNRSGWRYFQATFDGQNDNGRFTLSGGSRGVALEVADAAGNVASAGTPLPPGMLSDGALRLDYTLRLVSDGGTLRAGDLRTILRFRLDYN